MEQIAGSAGRTPSFDRVFLPAKAGVGERRKRIDRALHRGEELPSVSLYEIGDSYFGADGNHRVSVTRYHGAERLDTEVTEFPMSVASLMVALATLVVFSCLVGFSDWILELYLYAATRWLQPDEREANEFEVC